MNWDAFGAIGEWIGGIATVGTVFYLAYQVRQNTKSARTESYQSVVAAISEWTREVGSSPDSSRIFQKGSLDFGSLSDEELVQFNLLMAALVRNLENIHYQYQSGVIASDTWVGWAKRTYTLLEPNGARQWWGAQQEAYSPAFREFINNQKPDGTLPESAVKR